jgi:nitroreductase
MLAVALVAQERGLGSCFQESWATVRESLRRHFNLPESEMIYCGMALGYPDPQAPINTLRSARASVEEFAQLRGFS